MSYKAWAALDATAPAAGGSLKLLTALKGPTRFTLHPPGPYSLAASACFLEAFAPAAHEAVPEGHLHLALPGPQDEPAGVCLRQEEDGGAVLGEIFGAVEPDFVRAEARMAAELGDPVDIHGDVRHAFPPPRRLAGLEAFPRLFGRKAEWLRALGEAADAGALDAAHLRSLSSRTPDAVAPLLHGSSSSRQWLVITCRTGSPPWPRAGRVPTTRAGRAGLRPQRSRRRRRGAVHARRIGHGLRGSSPSRGP